MNESGLYKPSRLPLVIIGVAFAIFFALFVTNAKGDGDWSDSSYFLYVAPFIFFANVVPLFTNFVRVTPAEIVVRTGFVMRKIPMADVLSLDSQGSGKQNYLAIKYRDAAGKTQTFKFNNLYAQADVAGMVKEIQAYNAGVVLDKDLTYFMGRVAAASAEGKPLAFIGYTKPVISSETLAKYWWVVPLILAVGWLVYSISNSGA